MAGKKIEVVDDDDGAELSRVVERVADQTVRRMLARLAAWGGRVGIFGLGVGSAVGIDRMREPDAPMPVAAPASGPAPLPPAPKTDDVDWCEEQARDARLAIDYFQALADACDLPISARPKPKPRPKKP